MDKVSDFFSELTARMRSPFFFSFVFSWTVYNWKVPLSIILYSKSDLKELGYKSHFDFIDQFGNWQSYCVPLLFAIIYTASSPGIKALSTIVQAWFKKEADKKVRGMHTTSWLPMSVFIRRQDAFQKQQEFLQDLLSKEIEMSTDLQEKTNYNNKLLVENSDLRSQIKIFEENLLSSKQKVEKLETISDELMSVALMDGFWQIETLSKDSERKVYYAKIVKGKVAIISSEDTTSRQVLGIKNVIVLPPNEVILVFTNNSLVPEIAKYSSNLLNDLMINNLNFQSKVVFCSFTRMDLAEPFRSVLTKIING